VESVKSKPVGCINQMDHKTMLTKDFVLIGVYLFLRKKRPGKKSKEHKGLNPMEICVGTPK
jgi:hypothetical protein